MKKYWKITALIFATLRLLPASAELGKFSEFKAVNVDGASGTFSASNGNFHLSNSGSNGTFFVFHTFSGNGQISARVRRSAPSPGEIGLLFRQSTNSISPSAGAFLASTNTIFKRVLDLKQPQIMTVLTNETFEWLRVVREGSAFSGFYSSDGTNWTQLSADSIQMLNNVYAGFAISGTGKVEMDQVTITSARLAGIPKNPSLLAPTNLFLKTDVASLGADVKIVEFFAEARQIGAATNFPFVMVWTNAFAGERSLTAKIVDSSGAEFFTEPVALQIEMRPTQASFLKVDLITRGEWEKAYGMDGYMVAHDATNLPPYVQFESTGLRSYTWHTPVNPKRDLVRMGGAKRHASTWYNPQQIELELKFVDGRPHRVAIYFLDWDRRGRKALVEVLDPLTQTVLNSQDLISFSEGKYLVWSVSGHVRIRITAVTINAVMNGIFFDPL